MDGYSPIYTPDSWSEGGSSYSLGTKGLLAWCALPTSTSMHCQQCTVTSLNETFGIFQGLDCESDAKVYSCRYASMWLQNLTSVSRHSMGLGCDCGHCLSSTEECLLILYKDTIYLSSQKSCSLGLLRLQSEISAGYRAGLVATLLAVGATLIYTTSQL